MSDQPSNYLDPYREAVRAGGARFESLLWKSPEAQRLRFDVMIDTAHLEGRTIADLGAGLGDFAVRMHERGVAYARFLAVEGIEDLAAESARRFADLGVPNTGVVVADFVADRKLFARLAKKEGADVFAFSGSLNTLPQPQAEEVLDRAWEAIRRKPNGQLVFNFLSDRTRRRRGNTGPAHRFDTARLVSWALDRTPLAVLRHDYWEGHDATVWMGVG